MKPRKNLIWYLVFFGVNEYSKKVNILNRIMGTGDIHFVGVDNYPDVKQKYELCVQTFIDGSWKTAKNMSKVNKILEVLSNMED